MLLLAFEVNAAAKAACGSLVLPITWLFDASLNVSAACRINDK